ncbi:MAG TPA: hypothetical protein VJ302_02550 [Blastocatellia bacterium]|nr:hypothetical protein [Blastocatellia bacterium]
MGSSRRTISIWTILSLTLIPLTALCAVLATLLVDAFVIRPIPASVNTVLPGWTYASASVMKVCLVAGVVSAVLALMNWARLSRFPFLRLTAVARSQELQGRTRENSSEKIIPIWSLLSIALLPFAPLVGAIAVLTVQALLKRPEGFTMSDCSFISRTGVLIMLTWIGAGTLLGVMALLKSERPRLLGALAVMMNALLVGLFWYLKFYQMGFDQDRWAAP